MRPPRACAQPAQPTTRAREVATHCRECYPVPCANGTAFAYRINMRRCLTLVVGILIGQWLTFGATPSPADLYSVGLAARERRGCPQRLPGGGHEARLQPRHPGLHLSGGSPPPLARQRHA